MQWDEIIHPWCNFKVEVRAGTSVTMLVNHASKQMATLSSCVGK